MPLISPVMIAFSIVLAIEAIVGDQTIHGFIAAAVISPFNVIVEPTQTELKPVITGNALTEILLVVLQPFPFV